MASQIGVYSMRSYGISWLLLMMTAVAPAVAVGQLRGEKPELVRVTDQVYCASGYALGNTMFVITSDCVVVIDTTESPDAAQAALRALQQITQLPVRYIIYTHFHGDHINGAIAFRPRDKSSLNIIAQANHDRELFRFQALRNYNRRLNAIQFGAGLKHKDVTLELALDPNRPTIGYMRPTMTFDAEYKFEVGGIPLELYHTTGETDDHLMVWLPQQRVLFPGDLYYHSFPMLSSPMKHDRPVIQWAESLERMAKLEPEFLVPSHTQPLQGTPLIKETLGHYAQAIRHVHDETVRCINQGMSLAETRTQVQLPEHLAKKPYLAERYGRVAWSVNGIYRQYTGWYDMFPANLNPGQPMELHKEIVAASGGPLALLNHAQQAQEQGRLQLALELLTIVLNADLSNTRARVQAASVLRGLAEQSTNNVERNVYLLAAQEHEEQMSLTK
ncbi:MAG: MBL fold metallo-hydrolase [Pirellulaceae bacterium]|nr:MBL fold metallo-hydrolase [Pirellulaceae bacterium]